MTRKTPIAISAIILILVLSITIAGFELLSQKTAKNEPEILFGVDVGYGDENEVYKVADAVQGYANLIIIGSLVVTNDTAKLTRVCDYLYDRGFNFIVYVGFDLPRPGGPDREFFNTTAKKWGNKLLGAYIFDEPGGKQLDYTPGTKHYGDKPVKQADNYTDATQKYIGSIYDAMVNITGPQFYDSPNLRIFTSDYALYWFDYLAGYNVVFGEFVGNQSRQLSVALCRGASHAHNMDWGTMITWKYDRAPFLEEPDQLYDDMVLAYENDARYIVVFNSPENQTPTSDIGTLTPQHLAAMQRFWDYAIKNPRGGEYPAQTAFVLPSDYAFGFRRPDDPVWGLPWVITPSSAAIEAKIWNDANTLVQQYGSGIDIVYETYTDGFPIRLMYKELIFWNGTRIGHLDE